uniref:Uncharacterized protein n=1 Tax=Anguilla anguilla TaxID=7936 RepID=A0A0E9TJG1_ANGAN
MHSLLQSNICVLLQESVCRRALTELSDCTLRKITLRPVAILPHGADLRSILRKLTKKKILVT